MTVISMLVFIAALFLAYSNGANDNFKGVATLYGSGLVSYRTALTWATVATSAGSVTSVLLAAALVKSFSGKGLVSDAIASTAEFHLAVAISAGLTVILATWRGLPISTTHGITGALLGVGWIASGGQVNFAALGQSFILPLLLSPVLAIGLAMVLYLFVHQLRLKTQANLCACVGESATFLAIANNSGAIGGNVTPRITIDTVENCAQIYPGKFWGINTQQLVNASHFASAGIVSFARGLNDTPKILALIMLMPSISIQGMAIAVGMGMAIGGWLNARQVAEKMSKQIATMNPGQGLVGNLITGVLVIAASRLGLPVSTTHVAVGSIFGVGVISGQANHQIFIRILLAWVLTLPISALLGGAIFGIGQLF